MRGKGGLVIDNKCMNTKRVHMKKGASVLGSEALADVGRRVQRRRILEVLHGICLKLEHMQQTRDARLACREVAELLSAARRREGGRGPGRGI